MKYLLVMAGGAAGTLLRYVVGATIMSRYGGRFPLGTLAVNLSGSFLIGLAMTLLTERFAPHPNLRLFLVIGLLGGYTTFSSFEWETYAAMREGGTWLGLANIAGSVTLGYAAVWLGVMLGRR
ncbi:MAG TPA: fluoride efflux transporter CrcB [Bryobacteraceae bacterium]|nr:fluoride efflux transporter CrcB [Bryobacteraceae bacterium]